MFSTPTQFRRRSLSIGDLIFLEFFGAVFIGVGLFATSIQKVDPSWIRTQGEVIDLTSSYNPGLSSTYYPVYQYSVNGHIYKFTRSWSSNEYLAIGSKQEIAYNPNQPGQAKAVESTKNWIISSLFPVTGIVVAILSAILFIKSLKRSKVIKNLIQIGQKIEGTIVKVKSVGGPKGTKNYKITLSATDNSGITKEYISDRVSRYADLTSIDFHKNPIRVGIYINPTNSEQYYVDIDGIPDFTSLSKDSFMQLSKR